MANIVGARTTSQSYTTENRLVRNVGAEIADLEPNQAAVLTFLMKLDKRKPVDNPKFEWLEQDYVPRWTTLGEALDNSETDIDVADGTLFVAGDIFVIPRADNSTTALEQFRVLSVAGNTVTVATRDGTGQTAASGDAIRIIGNAYEENANQPSSKVASPVTKTSYTQIFRTSMAISRTAAMSKHYGAPGGERKREQAKKLVEHKIKMNGQFLFGKASESLTGGPNSNPLRTTMGLNSVVTTNVYDASSTLTRKGFEAFSQIAFRYGATKKMLLSSPTIASAIHDWGNSHMQLSPSEKVFGVDIQRIETGHGQLMLVRDWMLEDGAGSSLNGFAGWAFVLDPDSLMYRYLAGDGRSADTHLIESDLENGSNNGRDGFVDEYLTEAGFQIEVEKRHAKMYNVTDYSA